MSDLDERVLESMMESGYGEKEARKAISDLKTGEKSFLAMMYRIAGGITNDDWLVVQERQPDGTWESVQDYPSREDAISYITEKQADDRALNVSVRTFRICETREVGRYE